MAESKRLKSEDKGFNVRLTTAFVTCVAVSFSLFELYTGLFGERENLIQRSACLGFSLALVFLVRGNHASRIRSSLNIAFAIIGLSSLAYIAFFFDDISERAGVLTPFEIWFGIIIIVLVLEATRRMIGWALPIVCLVFILYAFVGPYLPGILGNPGYRLDRVVSEVYLGEDGIYGLPIGVASTFVYMFVLLGAFLQRSGAGAFFTDLAFSLTGRYRGGPAKVSVVSSALFGTLSGSSVANASAVGNFSIPLMVRLGYRPPFAASIEALASLGGQIMPPVMGAAAFIMVELTGISYLKIAGASLLPAIVYFVTLFFIVDSEALKLGLGGLPKSDLPQAKTVFKDGWLLLTPIVVLFTLLYLGFSVFLAGFWTIPFTIAVTALKPNLRMDLPKIIGALKDGAITILPIVMACSCAGIVIGIASMTGLALTLSNALVLLSGGHLIVLLLLTMVASLILGMGLPTVACYIMLSILVAPALEQMGVPLLGAHLFIFYFGIVGGITPPVAIVSYTTAALAKSNPVTVSLLAFRLGFALYVLPFVWIYSPALLGSGAFWATAIVFLSTLAGCYLLVAGIQGWFKGPSPLLERGLLIIAAGGFLYTSYLSDLMSLPLVAALFGWKWYRRRRLMEAEGQRAVISS